MTQETRSDWQEKSFSELFEIKIGGTPSRSKPEYWATESREGAWWASIRDMRQSVITQTKERITPEGAQRSNVKLLPAGTVIMSFKLTLGRVALAGVPLYTNEAIAGLIPRDEEILPEYVLHALPYVDLRAELDAAIKGQTLNKDKLGRLKMRYPKQEEQQRIATLLSDATESIKAGAAFVEQLQALKRGAMHELLTKGVPGWHTVFQETALGLLPEGWEVRKLETLGRVQAGRQRSPHHVTGQLRPYLRVANVFDGFINTSDVLEMQFTDKEFAEYHLRFGDILLNEGQSLELVGRSAMYIGSPANCCFQNTLVRFRSGNDIIPEFALQLFRHFLYSGRFMSIAKKTTSIAHLGVSRFAALQVALPSLAEQQEIVEVLAAFDECIRVEQERQRQLEQVQAALAQQLLSGKLLVPDLQVVAT